MRKITEQVVDAFMRGDSFASGNSQTDGDTIWLHGNAIAWREGRDVVIHHATWHTRTTRERLNGLLNVIAPHLGVVQRDYVEYIQDTNANTLLPFGDPYVIEG